MTQVRKAVFIALVVAEVAAQYAKVDFAKDVLGALAVSCWILALGPADRTSRRISLALVAVGSLVFIRSGATLRQAVESFSENTNVLMVMVLIPLLGVVVDLGGYADALSVASRNVTKPLNLYVLSMLLAFAIGSVLLNASIALLWVVLHPVAERSRDDPQWFLVKCLPRGYNASLLWTPSSPSTAVALGVTGAMWTRIAGPGFAMSLAMLAVAVLLEKDYLTARPERSSTEKDRPGESDGPKPVDAEERHNASLKLAALGTGLLSFIVSIVALEALGVTIYQAVLPCVLGTALIWGTLIRKGREAAVGLVKRLNASMAGMSTQFLLMTTAGFIGTAVKLATAGGLAAYLSGVAAIPTLFAFLMSFLVVILSILGIHPQIGMVIVYSLFSSVAGSYPPHFVALALMLGAALGYNVSPVSATMLVTSSCAKTNTIEVGVKRHWKHALVVLPLGTLILRALVQVR